MLSVTSVTNSKSTSLQSQPKASGQMNQLHSLHNKMPASANINIAEKGKKHR